MKRAYLFLLAAMAVGMAQAQPVSLRGAVRMDDAQLAQVRGGFTSAQTGLSISFGIERAVFVNGEPATAALQSAGANGLVLVQRGAGNSFDVASLAGVAAGTVVQNTLDNQRIQTVTTLNIQANSLQVLGGMNLRSAIGNAVAASLQR